MNYIAWRGPYQLCPTLSYGSWSHHSCQVCFERVVRAELPFDVVLLGLHALSVYRAKQVLKHKLLMILGV